MNRPLPSKRAILFDVAVIQWRHDLGWTRKSFGQPLLHVVVLSRPRAGHEWFRQNVAIASAVPAARRGQNAFCNLGWLGMFLQSRVGQYVSL